MENIEQQVPQILVQGIKGLQRIEKIVSRNVDFAYDDLDQADELREAINLVRNDLFNYNQAARQTKIQQLQQQQAQQQATPELPEAKTMKAVDVNKGITKDVKKDSLSK